MIKSLLHNPDLTTLWKRPFENSVGKGENAGNQHFLLFPQCFLPFPKQISFLFTFKLSSANAFNLYCLKFRRLVKGSALKTAWHDQTALMCRLILLYTVCKISQMANKVSIYSTHFWPIAVLYSL